MYLTYVPDYVALNLRGSGAFGYIIEVYDRKEIYV